MPLRAITACDRPSEWSYGLPDLSWRRRCSVGLEPFVGGFTAPLAQDLCSAPDAEMEALDPWLVLDALSALVDKSLGNALFSNTERFHLLESAREFARLQLEANGESTPARRRHVHAMALAFDTAQREVHSCRDSEWIARKVAGEAQPSARRSRALWEDGDPDTLATLAKSRRWRRWTP